MHLILNQPSFIDQPKTTPAISNLETTRPHSYIKSFHGDLRLILDAFERYELDIKDYLNPEYQEFSEDIKKLKGNQLNNLIGSMLACAGSLFAFSMNGAIAAQCTALPFVLRATVAASPLLVGGFLRIYSAYQADQGRGKENILQLLGLSVLGMLGNIMTLRFMVEDEDLSTLTPEQCWPLIISGAFIGLGLGTYSSGMTLGARTAANNSIDLWHDNLQEISDILKTALADKGTITSSDKINIKPGFMSKSISFILRNHAAIYSAVIAGVANTSPSIPITLNAYAEIFKLSNSVRIGLFAGIQIMAMGGIYLFLNNPMYDQLLKNNNKLTPEQAKKIATYTGQALFSSGLTFWNEIEQLTPSDMQELWSAIMIYSASYGVLTSITTTGTFTLMSRCVPHLDASLTIARAVTVSAICRVIPLVNTTLTPTQLNQGSLLIMSMALGIFAFVNHDNIPESMMYIYTAFCGVVCFAVVARLVTQTPDKVGLVTGASSGIGAFVGFPLSVLMAWLQEYNPTDGVCPSGVVHNTQSFQLLLPALVSATTLILLSTPDIKQATSSFRKRFSMFEPVPVKAPVEPFEMEQIELPSTPSFNMSDQAILKI
jgi:hypothetical protein